MQKGKTNIYATKAYKLGNSGENKVVLTLETFIPKENIIHNTLLKDGNDTHQIDVIAITSQGIFVIEVKNVCGYKIKCENDQMYWTYDWKKNGELINCRLYNPIWQNETHVYEVRKIVGDEYPIYSMITFSNNNTLVHENPLNEMVVSLKDIKKYFDLFPKNKLSDKEIVYLRELIKKNHHPEISLQEHVDNIRRKF